MDDKERDEKLVKKILQRNKDKHSRNSKLEITHLEISHLDKSQYRISKLSDSYLIKLLETANSLGLHGKRIAQVYSIEDINTNTKVIDFRCVSDH